MPSDAGGDSASPFEGVKKLLAAGVDFLVIASNTGHCVSYYIMRVELHAEKMI